MDNVNVLKIVYQAIDDLNSHLKAKDKINKSPETVIFGPSGKLDSLELLNLIVGIEELVQEKFGVSVVLADEKALSRAGNPFRSVQSLVDFVTAALPPQPAPTFQPEIGQ